MKITIESKQITRTIEKKELDFPDIIQEATYFHYKESGGYNFKIKIEPLYYTYGKKELYGFKVTEVGKNTLRVAKVYFDNIDVTEKDNCVIKIVPMENIAKKIVLFCSEVILGVCFGIIKPTKIISREEFRQALLAFDGEIEEDKSNV